MQTVNLGFTNGLAGWNIQEIGGSAQGKGTVTAGSAILREGDSFLVSIEHELLISENALSLSFTYQAFFDTTDPDFVNDAFEAALLDSDGFSLVDTFHGERDSYFNLTEGLLGALGGGTTVDEVDHSAAVGGRANRVTLDVRDIPAGSGVNLVFRLVNNDTDTETYVRIFDVELNEGNSCSLSGYVYADVNNNGIKDAPELVLPNVPILLHGAVERETTTNANGWYEFTQLPPGTYQVEEIQPQAFLDGLETLGTPQSGHAGHPGESWFHDLQLPAQTKATDYNFGERGLKVELISKQFYLASSPNGQQLVSSIVASQGTNWFTFAAETKGSLVAIVTEPFAGGTLELYTADLMPVAITRDESTLIAQVAEGDKYVLHVAGAASQATVHVDLSITPNRIVPGQSPYAIDVNSDGWVSPLDALLVINHLNKPDSSTGELTDAARALDVDHNGAVSPLDALLVINYLNQKLSAEGEFTTPLAVGSTTGVLPSVDLVDTVDAFRLRGNSSASVMVASDAEGESDDGPPQSPSGDTLLGSHGEVVFATSDDFLAGELFNVNVTEVPDELRLDPPGEVDTFPFIWIANSGEGTISRFDTRTGREVGRYATGPAFNTDPSRIVVTPDGDAWVANRGDNSTIWGNAVKILRESFVDRNGNGLLDTCQDLNDDGYITGGEILPWDTNGDGQPDDERIALVVHAGRDRNNPAVWNYGGGARGIAVDTHGKLWVGLNGHHQYEVFDEATGQFERIVPVNGNPYGAVIAPNGVLYSANAASRYLDAIDTNTRQYLGPIDVQSGMYGITVDPQGIVWLSPYGGDKLIRYDTNTAEVTLYAAPNNWDSGAGISVDRNATVWAGKYNANGMLKWMFAEDHKTLLTSQYVDVPGAGGSTKASAVDADGYVWTTSLNSSKTFKIDPATNQVVLTRDTGYYPYNYSDMTGHIRIGSTERTGTWTEIMDSQVPGQPWGTVAVDSFSASGQRRCTACACSR